MKKQNNIYFHLKDNKLLTVFNSDEHDIFSCFKHVFFQKEAVPHSEELNTIWVSPETLSYFTSDKLLLINIHSQTFINVVIKAHKNIQNDCFATSSYIKEMLDVIDNENLYLGQYKEITFNKIFIQRIEHIKENNLMLSRDDYQKLIDNLDQLPCSLFEVYNDLTHESIIVKRSHIYADESLKNGTIRLSKKQRIFLGQELPLFLSNEQWDILIKSFPTDSEEYRLLCSSYSLDDHILSNDLSFTKKEKLKQIISSYGIGKIKIIPILEFAYEKKKDIRERLSNFYVGKSTISLIGKRPYTIDDGLDIVRMSKANMNLLGINEMDKVILQYKNRRKSCRVLELKSKDAFLENNRPISMDLAIGIPTHIRKELCITDLTSCIKIDRDTRFIFKKNINAQIVPILLTLFSANFFADSSVLWSSLFSLVAIPIVLYLNLSSTRNMRT